MHAGLGEAMELEAHADDLMEVVLKVSQTSSPALNDVAGSVLAATLLELTSPRLRLDAVPHTTLPGCPGVAAWLPGRGSAAPRPRWRAPPPSAHAAARALALRAAAEAAAAVAALTAEGRLDSTEPAARQALHRALILAFAVSEGLLAAAEPPLLSAEAAAARDADAAHALTVSMPPVSDAWRDCSFYREALDLAMVVLEKASESGTTNATVALSLIEVRRRAASPVASAILCPHVPHGCVALARNVLSCTGTCRLCRFTSHVTTPGASCLLCRMTSASPLRSRCTSACTPGSQMHERPHHQHAVRMYFT